MKYYLLEDLPPDFKLPDNSKAVSLTITASYKLEVKGIQFLLLQDFYSQSEICEDTEEYLDSQLDWINEFSHFIQDIYPVAKDVLRLYKHINV